MLKNRKFWNILAAIISGLLTSTGFPFSFSPSSPLAWLIPFALIPLLIAVEALPTTYQSPTRAHATTLRPVTPLSRGRDAFLLFWIYGAVLVAIAFRWVTVPAVLFGELSPALSEAFFVLYCAAAGLYFPLLFSPVIWNAARCSRRGTHPFPIWSLVFSVTLLELFIPRFFHWTFGNLLHGSLSLSQWASWIGSSGLTALVVASNMTIARSIAHVARNPGRMALQFSLVLGCWGLVFLIGDSLLKSLREQQAQARHTTVGFVQPNFRFPGIPRHPELAKEATLQSLDSLVALTDELMKSMAGKGPVDLLVWPESAAPFDFAWSSENQKIVQQKVHEWNTPLLVQASEFDQKELETLGPRKATLYSTSFLLRTHGPKSQSFRKWIPIPFGESVPLEDKFPWLGDMVRDNVNNISKLGRGQSPDTLAYNPQDRVAPLICFDAISSDLTRAQSTLGHASIYVNQANFIWMWKSNAAYEFLELGRFRAIENGRSFILAANTGPSVALKPTGEAVAPPLPLMSRGYSVASLPVLEHRTLYARWGDGPLIFLGLLAIASQIFMSRPQLRRR